MSQGIARGYEALLPKLAPAPLPQAPLPQPAPALQPTQVWRVQQSLEDGTVPVVMMGQGQHNGLWNGGASAGPGRLSGWQ